VRRRRGWGKGVAGGGRGWQDDRVWRGAQSERPQSAGCLPHCCGRGRCRLRVSASLSSFSPSRCVALSAGGTVLSIRACTWPSNALRPHDLLRMGSLSTTARRAGSLHCRFVVGALVACNATLGCLVVLAAHGLLVALAALVLLVTRAVRTRRRRVVSRRRHHRRRACHQGCVGSPT